MRALPPTEPVGERPFAEHLHPALPDGLRESELGAPERQGGVRVQDETGVRAVGGAVSVRLVARRLRAGADVELPLGEPDFDDAAEGVATQGP